MAGKVFTENEVYCLTCGEVPCTSPHEWASLRTRISSTETIQDGLERMAFQAVCRGPKESGIIYCCAECVAALRSYIHHARCLQDYGKIWQRRTGRVPPYPLRSVLDQPPEQEIRGVPYLAQRPRDVERPTLGISGTAYPGEMEADRIPLDLTIGSTAAACMDQSGEMRLHQAETGSDSAPLFADATSVTNLVIAESLDDLADWGDLLGLDDSSHPTPAGSMETGNRSLPSYVAACTRHEASLAIKPEPDDVMLHPAGDQKTKEDTALSDPQCTCETEQGSAIVKDEPVSSPIMSACDSSSCELESCRSDHPSSSTSASPRVSSPIMSVRDTSSCELESCRSDHPSSSTSASPRGDLPSSRECVTGNHGENPLECDICYKIFKYNASLLTHKQRHSKTNPFVCTICKKGFSLKSRLKVHQRVHCTEKPYTCDICQKAFAQRCHLQAHQRLHSGEKPFCCNICKRGFARQWNLQVHQRVHAVKQFLCDICNKTFRHSDLLLTHKQIHSEANPFVCNICNKTFSGKSSLKVHQRLHSGEMPFVCNICKKGFTQPSDLQAHQENHSEKKFQCNICNKTFKSSDSLRQHKLRHSGEKPFVCDICNKAFSVKGNLKVHQSVHSGEKPYTCDVCKKAFAQRGHLRAHERLHSGERPFVCNICNKRFAQQWSHRVHQRVHSGGEFVCDICGKFFKHSDSLRKHKKKHSE